MPLQLFVYFLKRMLHILRVNPAGASIAFIMSTLFLLSLGISYTGYRTGQHLFPAWAAHNKAVIYLEPQASSQEMDELAKEMGKWKDITQVKVTTADEGRKRLQNDLGEWKDVLDSIPETTFPPSLEISLSEKLDSPDEIEALFAKIRQYPQVEDVFYGKSRVEKLEFFLEPVRRLGIGATGLLGFLTLLMVYHSTMLVLHARRDEMELCSILGATPLFTKIPFYMESLFSGAMSGIVASICLAFIVSWLKSGLPMPISAAVGSHGVETFLLVAGLTCCGAALSLSGRWLAFKRALKIVNPLADSAGQHEQSP
jgi:cell division transport system permease protein